MVKQRKYSTTFSDGGTDSYTSPTVATEKDTEKMTVFCSIIPDGSAEIEAECFAGNDDGTNPISIGTITLSETSSGGNFTINASFGYYIIEATVNSIGTGEDCEFIINSREVYS